MKLGAVCDVSVLAGAEQFRQGRRLMRAPLFLPSSTYSWVLRDKAIGVRSYEIGYSLLGCLVRERKVVAVYLPELLDEIGRHLLFAANRQIPLTDIRAVLLAAHLGLPVVSLDSQLKQELVEHLGARSLGVLGLGNGCEGYARAVGRYQRLARSVGFELAKRLGNGSGAHLEASLGFQGDESPDIGIECLVIDLFPVLNRYLEDQVLPRAVIEELCRYAAVGVVGPG